MGYDCDMNHRNREWNVAADYFSYLGVDLTYDPLLRDYLQRSYSMRRENPVEESLPIKPENMPGFRGPRIKSKLQEKEAAQVDLAATTLISQIVIDDSNGHVCLEHVPVKFGQRKQQAVSGALSLYNNDLPTAAYQCAHFTWAVYGFNDGHFISSTRTRNLPFDIVLAVDHTKQGRGLFSEFSGCSLRACCYAFLVVYFIVQCGQPAGLPWVALLE